MFVSDDSHTHAKLFQFQDFLTHIDVRDYCALGDGTTDDRAAFIAADAASLGREI